MSDDELLCLCKSQKYQSLHHTPQTEHLSASIITCVLRVILLIIVFRNYLDLFLFILALFYMTISEKNLLLIKNNSKMICDNIKFSIQWGYFDIIIQRFDKHIYGCISFCPYLDGHVSLTDLIKFARVP